MAYQPPPVPAIEEVTDAWSPGPYESESSTCDDCGDAGCDECCGTCFDECATRCAPWGLSAGVEATYLEPHSDNSNEGINFNLDYDFEAAPRIWLAWQNQSGWGVRARYWDLDASQQLSAARDFGDALVAQSIMEDIEAQTIDLELTRAFSIEETNGCLSLGARHGRLHQHDNLQFTIFDVGGGGGDDASVILQDFDRGLDGTGMTMALDLRRPILQSRLAAICNLRGSIIWGTNELDGSVTVIEVVPAGVGDLDLNDFQELHFFGSDNEGMWIGELQAGGEWNTPISQAYGGGNAFIRVLFEAQWWNLPGVSTGDDSIATERQVYDFIGVTASAGFTR
jgi:hypothetical protein